MKKLLLAIFVSVITTQPAFAHPDVLRTGIGNGAPCAVILRVNDNGFLTGISMSGLGVVSRIGAADTSESMMVDLLGSEQFASQRFFQSPMMMTLGNTLHNYYDTSLFTAEENKIEIFGDLLNPTDVVVLSTHLEGPFVKGPVTTNTLVCSELR